MAYTDQKMSAGRIWAIVIVAVIHAALGYAFVTGLAYQYVKKVANDMDVFDVEEPPPPPPDEPPPPPPDQPLTPPPVVSPPPIVRTPTPAPIMQTVQTPPPRIVMTPVVGPPDPPPPQPPRVSQAAKVQGNPGRFFGDDNYPDRALNAGAQGRVVARLTIGTNGRVTDCVVTTSSGNGDLDRATCDISKAKVKFTPARDDNGAPIGSSYPLSVRWTIPEDR